MRPYTKRLECYGDPNDDAPAREPVACDNLSLIEIAREECTALTGLIGVLKREREAILALSLKDITETNSEKERMANTLATLKRSREACLNRLPEYGSEQQSPDYLALAGTLRLSTKEARTYIRKNGALLALSAGRVRSAMEFIASSLKSKSTTYGREAAGSPVLFSRRI